MIEESKITFRLTKVQQPQIENTIEVFKAITTTEMSGMIILM